MFRIDLSPFFEIFTSPFVLTTVGNVDFVACVCASAPRTVAQGRTMRVTKSSLRVIIEILRMQRRKSPRSCAESDSRCLHLPSEGGYCLNAEKLYRHIAGVAFSSSSLLRFQEYTPNCPRLCVVSGVLVPIFAVCRFRKTGDSLRCKPGFGCYKFRTSRSDLLIPVLIPWFLRSVRPVWEIPLDTAECYSDGEADATLGTKLRNPQPFQHYLG